MHKVSKTSTLGHFCYKSAKIAKKWIFFQASHLNFRALFRQKKGKKGHFLGKKSAKKGKSEAYTNKDGQAKQGSKPGGWFGGEAPEIF